MIIILIITELVVFHLCFPWKQILRQGIPIGKGHIRECSQEKITRRVRKWGRKEKRTKYGSNTKQRWFEEGLGHISALFIRGKWWEHLYRQACQPLIKGCSWGLCRGQNHQGKLVLLGATGKAMAEKVWLLAESTPRTTLTASARVILNMKKPFKGNTVEFWFSCFVSIWIPQLPLRTTCNLRDNTEDAK